MNCRHISNGSIGKWLWELGLPDHPYIIHLNLIRIAKSLLVFWTYCTVILPFYHLVIAVFLVYMTQKITVPQDFVRLSRFLSVWIELLLFALFTSLTGMLFILLTSLTGMLFILFTSLTGMLFILFTSLTGMLFILFTSLTGMLFILFASLTGMLFILFASLTGMLFILFTSLTGMLFILLTSLTGMLFILLTSLTGMLYFVYESLFYSEFHSDVGT